MADKKPKEVVFRDLKTKTIYHYIDEIIGINIKSKEVFKKIQKIIHYPFNARSGQPKYRTLKKITFEGIKEPLPAGFRKTFTRGYGFTRELAPIIYQLQDEYPSLENITISNSSSSIVTNKKEIVLNIKDIENLRPRIASIQERHREEQKVLSINLLSDIFPASFKKDKSKYTKNQLSDFIDSHTLKISQLSDNDLTSLADLISKIPSHHRLIKKGEILSTKKSFDKVFIEDLINKYEKLLKLKTDSKSLEKRWQKFFRSNILYFNFGYVEKFEKERIEGDKSINIPDFIMLNTYNYLDVFEIKTHLTQLLVFDKGRNNFYWASEASKAIIQAENYIDSIIKEEDTIIKNIRDEYDIHNIDAVRPVVYIIASSKLCIAGLETSKKYKGKTFKKLWNDFRRLNNSLKNIKFVLYDEILDVFNNTLIRLGGK